MDKMVIKSNSIRRFSLFLMLLSFVVFYFSDGLSKYFYRAGADFYRFSQIIKAFFTILILVYGIVTLNRSKANILIAIVLLIINFLIGQYFLSLKFKELDFIENVNTLFKYLFPFIFFFLVSDIKKLKVHPKSLIPVYKKIIGLNNVLLLIGFALGIPFLTTYTGPWRFGYDGLIFAQNEATFVFIFAITTFYYRRFYLKKKEIFFWVTLIPSLLVATKGLYLYMLLLMLFHLFIRVPLVKLVPALVGFVGIGYFIFSKVINRIILNSYEVFMYMYKKGGLLYALLSGRDTFIYSKFIPLINDNWTFPNYLFGGQDVREFYIEMGFFDLFLFFGVIGGLLYLYIFYKIYNLIPFERKFKLFFGVSLFLIISAAGHFFESGIAGIHFLFMLLIIYFSAKSISKKNGIE